MCADSRGPHGMAAAHGGMDRSERVEPAWVSRASGRGDQRVRPGRAGGWPSGRCGGAETVARRCRDRRAPTAGGRGRGATSRAERGRRGPARAVTRHRCGRDATRLGRRHARTAAAATRRRTAERRSRGQRERAPSEVRRPGTRQATTPRPSGRSGDRRRTGRGRAPRRAGRVDRRSARSDEADAGPDARGGERRATQVEAGDRAARVRRVRRLNPRGVRRGGRAERTDRPRASRGEAAHRDAHTNRYASEGRRARARVPANAGGADAPR